MRSEYSLPRIMHHSPKGWAWIIVVLPSVLLLSWLDSGRRKPARAGRNHNPTGDIRAKTPSIQPAGLLRSGVHAV
jgi:hypothetical protein